MIACYASLIGVMIPPGAPPAFLLGATLTVLAVSAEWWSLVTLFFALPAIRKGYQRARRSMDAVVCVVMIAMGGRLFLSR